MNFRNNQSMILSTKNFKFLWIITAFLLAHNTNANNATASAGIPFYKMGKHIIL